MAERAGSGVFRCSRDVALFDGKEPVKPGMPTDSIGTLRLSAAEAGRPVTALFNEERIVAQAGRHRKTGLRPPN